MYWWRHHGPRRSILNGCIGIGEVLGSSSERSRGTITTIIWVKWLKSYSSPLSLSHAYNHSTYNCLVSFLNANLLWRTSDFNKQQVSGCVCNYIILQPGPTLFRLNVSMMLPSLHTDKHTHTNTRTHTSTRTRKLKRAQLQRNRHTLTPTLTLKYSETVTLTPLDPHTHTNNTHSHTLRKNTGVRSGGISS